MPFIIPSHMGTPNFILQVGMPMESFESLYMTYCHSRDCRKPVHAHANIHLPFLSARPGQSA
jgi:hypothetical protein